MSKEGKVSLVLIMGHALLLAIETVQSFAAVGVDPDVAMGYIGPGSGLMGVVVFFAAFAALIVSFIGFLWYPIKRLRQKASRKAPGDDDHPLYER